MSCPEAVPTLEKSYLLTIYGPTKRPGKHILPESSKPKKGEKGTGKMRDVTRYLTVDWGKDSGGVDVETRRRRCGDLLQRISSRIPELEPSIEKLNADLRYIADQARNASRKKGLRPQLENFAAMTSLRCQVKAAEEARENIASALVVITNKAKDMQLQLQIARDTISKLEAELNEERLSREKAEEEGDELRENLESLGMRLKHLQDELHTDMDKRLLEIALKQSRQDLEKCSRQLSILQTDYNQVIPLREFQELEASHLLVVQEKARLRRDLDLAKTELATALQECEVLKRENATLSVANRSLSRYGTPRPDWEKCMECLESSQVEEWKKQGQKRSSREKLLILLRLVCSTRKPEIGPPQFFQGKGTGPGVPRYLRFEGLVRNRHLAPRDACLLIQDIWKGKCELKESPYKRIPLETYLGSYFEERYPKKFIRMEWSYNLIDACQRFPHDDVIGLFWGILCGKYDEEIYHSQRKIVQRLKKSLKEAAKQTGGEEVSIQAFIQVLRDEYPAISLKDLRELLDEAKCELKLHSTAKTIPFLPLVTLTDEGKAGGFLALLWKHRAKAQEEYVQDIGKALSKHKESSIGPYELSRALATVDPQIERSQMEGYVTWVFEKAPEDHDKAQPLLFETVIWRLQHGNIHRIGKAP